jgi:hypothetical protein
MALRGPDDDLLLYAYAVFALVTGSEDYTSVSELLWRARAAQRDGPDCRRPKRFALAEAGFFRCVQRSV